MAASVIGMLLHLVQALLGVHVSVRRLAVALTSSVPRAAT
jgi:hypothetical protein